MIRATVCLTLALAMPLTTVAQTSAARPPENAAMPADAALYGLLDQLRDTAQRLDGDVSRLQIDRWKTSSADREQSLSTSDSIRRNLAYAVPELIQKARSAPGSMNANFRLYRNLNALTDAFSLLAPGAAAFAGRESYGALEADLGQLDSVRRQLAERIDQLSFHGDLELAKVRAQTNAAPSKAPKRIVVDDNQPSGKKAKSSASSTH